MNTEQFNGMARALTPLIIGVLVYIGIDSATAALAATAILAIAAAVWSWLDHRQTALLQKTAKIDGVRVEVGPQAPEPLRKLAADKGVPDIVPSGKTS